MIKETAFDTYIIPPKVHIDKGSSTENHLWWGGGQWGSTLTFLRILILSGILFTLILISQDGVRLDIEDCCNMALCDTVCHLYSHTYRLLGT